MIARLLGPSTRRELAFDAGAFLLAVTIGIFAFGSQVDTLGDEFTHQDLDFAVGALACVVILFRRRWPLGVALALLPFGTFSAMASGATLVAVFGLAVRRPLRTVLPVGLLYCASNAIYVLTRPQSENELFGLVVGPMLIAAVVGWGMYVRARVELLESLGERARRAEAEQEARIEAARAAERARIAREMHDVLGHRLSLLSLHAGALEFGEEDLSSAEAKSAAVIRENAHLAMDDLRKVVGLMREGEPVTNDGPEPPQPTLTELPRLIEESRRSGMQLKDEIRLPLDDVPEAVGRQAYRIVQEGLTNARKHAPGCAVEIELSGGPASGLEISVINRLPVGAIANGDGPGAGLLGVNERADLVGGTAEHGPADGDFRLRAWLPWGR